MADVSTQHTADLGHHVRQGTAWLSASAAGENTTALSYAALELRFGIERLAVHYWRALLSRRIEEQDLREIESFKRVERRIYELGGHQREIDGHFEFMRIVLGAMNIEAPFHTPQIGKLSKFWHECSELCHIGWPLACSVPEVRTAAFATLSGVAEALSLHVSSLGWPFFNTRRSPSFETALSLERRPLTMSLPISSKLAYGHEWSFQTVDLRSSSVRQCRQLPPRTPHKFAIGLPPEFNPSLQLQRLAPHPAAGAPGR